MYEVYIHNEPKVDEKQCNINCSLAEESYKHPTYVRGAHAYHHPSHPLLTPHKVIILVVSAWYIFISCKLYLTVCQLKRCQYACGAYCYLAFTYKTFSSCNWWCYLVDIPHCEQKETMTVYTWSTISCYKQSQST